VSNWSQSGASTEVREYYSLFTPLITHNLSSPRIVLPMEALNSAIRHSFTAVWLQAWPESTWVQSHLTSLSSLSSLPFRFIIHQHTSLFITYNRTSIPTIPTTQPPAIPIINNGCTKIQTSPRSRPHCCRWNWLLPLHCGGQPQGC